MKWITRENVKVDRVACPWLIKKFVDPDAEFLFVPRDRVAEIAAAEGAIPYDIAGVELGHHGKKCSFDAIVEKYGLGTDPALVLLAKIVNGADTDNTLWNQPESAGLKAVAEGFRQLGFKNDHELNAAEWIVYDALYAWCRKSTSPTPADQPAGLSAAEMAAHVASVGMGAAGGLTAGAVLGAVGGPIGSAAGALTGTVAGALAGEATAAAASELIHGGSNDSATATGRSPRANEG